MKNLHGVLHGQHVNSVSWSTGYYARPVKRGGFNAKHGVVVINSVAIGSYKYNLAVVGTQNQTLMYPFKGGELVCGRNGNGLTEIG